MIKNKYKLFVFSTAFFGLLLILLATPATELTNKFIAGMCLGFVLSQAVFLLWIDNYQKDSYQEDDQIEKNIKFDNKNSELYNREYWWNSGVPPKFTDPEKDD